MNTTMCARPWLRVSWLLAVVLISATALGCGGGPKKVELVRVSGKITYHKQPVTFGTIVCFPEFDATVAQGKIAEDGSYSLSSYGVNDGAAIGKFRVAIIAQDEAELEGKMPEDFDPSKYQPKSLIPDVYFRQTTSGLTMETRSGEPMEIDFNLVDPPGKRRGSRGPDVETSGMPRNDEHATQSPLNHGPSCPRAVVACPRFAWACLFHQAGLSRFAVSLRVAHLSYEHYFLSTSVKLSLRIEPANHRCSQPE